VCGTANRNLILPTSARCIPGPKSREFRAGTKSRCDPRHQRTCRLPRGMQQAALRTLALQANGYMNRYPRVPNPNALLKKTGFEKKKLKKMVYVYWQALRLADGSEIVPLFLSCLWNSKLGLAHGHAGREKQAKTQIMYCTRARSQTYTSAEASPSAHTQAHTHRSTSGNRNLPACTRSTADSQFTLRPGARAQTHQDTHYNTGTLKHAQTAACAGAIISKITLSDSTSAALRSRDM
jgi:hypothetical protein